MLDQAVKPTETSPGKSAKFVSSRASIYILLKMRDKMAQGKDSKQIILEGLRSATVELSQSALVQEFNSCTTKKE